MVWILKINKKNSIAYFVDSPTPFIIYSIEKFNALILFILLSLKNIFGFTKAFFFERRKVFLMRQNESDFKIVRKWQA